MRSSRACWAPTWELLIMRTVKIISCIWPSINSSLTIHIRQIQAIQNAHEKTEDFFPNEDALKELGDLYTALKSTSPSQSL